jgi:choline dehydrogenase-like flavoprotein
MIMSPVELSKIDWDFVIVGTGMSGATIGYALAQGGQKVLFLEKGENYLDNSNALRGDYMEVLLRDRPKNSTIEEPHLNSGRWRGEIFDAAKKIFVRPMLGEGAGGSSAIYGMALERFFPSDFTPKRFHLKDTESTLPERWPVSYEDMRPYYEKAEDLYRVHSSSVDPCRRGESLHHLPVATPYHIATQVFERVMMSKNLGAYTIPFACEFKKDCRFCQGVLCDKDCKNDAAKICLQPALERFGAVLLTRFTVDRLNADGGKVTGVQGRWRGQQELVFHGRHVILATGALATPLLLQRSRSEQWPQGLANESGYVGRNLMRHLIDLYLLPSIWNFKARPISLKEIGWNDFYEVDGVKYGTFQPFGKFPPGFMALDDILFEMQQTAPKWVTQLFSAARPLNEKFFDFLFQRCGCAAPIMEDLPQWENRVEAMEPSADGRERISVHYRISQYDAQRLEQFRKMIGRAIRPYVFFRLPASQSAKLIAHACGTVRFGDDPKTSVLNKMNRAHGVENLYVVDASFFPSSGGINPSLTLAANALRVADHLLRDKK